EVFALGERIAYADGAVVVQAEYVAGDGIIGALAARGQELDGVVYHHAATEAHVPELHAAAEAARDDAQEGDAVVVGRVHVGLDLEDQPREPFFLRAHLASLGLARPGRRRPRSEAVHQLVGAEAVERRAEIDRGL